MERCSIGIHLSKTEDCHKTHYNRKCGLVKVFDLSDSDRQLLLRRTQYKEPDATTTVCFHHEKIFLSKYSFLQRNCCDPFGVHEEAPVRKSLRVLDLQTADDISSTTGKVVHPGQKICMKCNIKASSDRQCSTEDDSEMEVADIECGTSKEDKSMAYSMKQQTMQVVNTTLQGAGYSPLKAQKVSKRDLVGYGKRKVTEAEEAVKSQLATSLDVDQAIFEKSDSGACDKCRDFDCLLAELKEKLQNTTSTQKRLQILTLVPDTWSIEKTTTEFGVSSYMAKKSRALKREVGILGEAKAKKGKGLSQETVDKVHAFYNDDEYSRMCPGQKEFVSVKEAGERVQRQKRLLLLNLKELFAAFKLKEPDCKVGFSKFCELRPAWCVNVSAKGMHYVCVCEIHQNVKLLIAATPGVKSYEELMTYMVCDSHNRDCMIHRCSKCPGSGVFNEHVMKAFRDADMSDDDVVTFKQWSHSDKGCTLITRSEPVAAFVDELTRQYDNLMCHHYIAKSQAAFLSTCKASLDTETALILLDFAENYSFIVQDAVQGHHWDNTQATLHPFAVYHLVEGKVQCLSICVISDCLKHDSLVVHTFISEVVR